MKKQLVNLVITLRNFLNKTASRLDKQFRYFHIELLPTSNKFNFKYDTKETLDSFYTYCNVGAFKDQLLQLGAEDLLPQQYNVDESPVLTLLPNKLNPKDIVIAWEHYETNYLKKPTDIDLNEDFDDDDNEHGDLDIEDMIPEQFVKFGMIGQKEVHYTPWGKFENENPLSPIKLYNLQAVHLKGFKISDVTSNLKDFMSKIEGVAIWGQIDQYFIVIGPARMYDLTHVKHNFESAIYKALNFDQGNYVVKNLDEVYNTVKQQSLDTFNNGIENITIVFPDEQNTVEIIEKFTPEDLDAVDDLINRVSNLIVFINGEIYA